MTNIDKTKGAGNTNTTNRTNQTDSTDEADETSKSAKSDGGRQVDTNQTASTKTPPRPETVDRFRGFVGEELGQGRKPGDGGGKVQQAAILKANRQHPDPQMEERKEKLGKALDKQYETMGIDWDADEGFWDKSKGAWKQDYERQAFSSDKWKNSRETLEKSLYKNGRPMSDADIEEVVDKHKQRLEERDAFEGFSSDDIQYWEKGLTQHLKRQRSEQKIRAFETDPIEDLPTPSRDLDTREFDNPEQIRQKLDEWESEQLEELDKLAEEAGVEDDSVYTSKRHRIREAKQAYEQITVGDEDGTKYAFPETVEAGDDVYRPRSNYIEHLEDNPGDLVGAYREAEERLRAENWEEAAKRVAKAGA